jgi:hypothetical protein
LRGALRQLPLTGLARTSSASIAVIAHERMAGVKRRPCGNSSSAFGTGPLGVSSIFVSPLRSAGHGEWRYTAVPLPYRSQFVCEAGLIETAGVDPFDAMGSHSRDWCDSDEAARARLAVAAAGVAVGE